jgi:hypothetical protein
LFWQRELSIYIYYARDYDPVLKRFVSEDPIGLAGGVCCAEQDEFFEDFSKMDGSARGVLVFSSQPGGFD